MGWSRPQLKDWAKRVLLPNYWQAFGASLIVALLCGQGPAGRWNVQVGNVQETYYSLHYYARYVGTFIVLLLLLVFALVVAYGVFVAPVVQVGEKRFFMEFRQEPTQIRKLFSAFRGPYYNVVGAMFTTRLFVFLWGLLLVVPGIIKHYEYYFVPYILAENPHISGDRARQISSWMTRGEKWDIFVLELSFIGWYLLGSLFFGIGTFFVLPYQACTTAELYAYMHYKALSQGLARADELPGFAAGRYYQ